MINHFKSLRQARIWLAGALAVLLMMTSMAGAVHAADDTVTGIEFESNTPTTVDVVVDDDKVDLTVLATVSGSSSKKDVTNEATWKSSNTSYVKVENGVLTGVGKGTATISATYKGFTVSVKAASDYMYDSVTLKQGNDDAPTSLDIELGQSLSFKLQGTKAGAATDITDEAVWTSSNSSVATVEDGEITFAGIGSVTITAKLKGKSDSILIKVASPYKSISIDSGSTNKLLEMVLGSDESSLIASVLTKTGETLNVTNDAKWSSANDKVASVDKGVVTAEGAGITTITVSHRGVSATIEVAVRSAYQSIKLTPEKEYHLQLHDAPLQITAEVLNNSNVTENVTSAAEWKSSNVVVATVVDGKVTPKAVGSTKITASYKGVNRSIDITVYPSISELSIESTEIDAYIGNNKALPTVTATTFDGSQIDVSKLVTWTTEDEEIVSIEKGKWTAHKIGESVLTATIQGLEAEVNLIVHTKPLKLIADVKELNLVIGKEVALPSVNVVNEDGKEEDISSRVTWTTKSDNLVIMPETLKGIEESTVTLTATYLDKSTTVKVKIEEEIVQLVVEPTTIELYPGKSKSVKVTGYYKSGKKVSLGSKMNWESGNINLATVKGASVKAVAVGTTKISGSYQGKSVVVPVVVSPKLKSLALSSKSVKLSPGATYSVTLQANYTTISPSDVTAAAVWTSSKSSVATVKNGQITAVGKGSTSIKATYAGKTVTIRVTVK